METQHFYTRIFLYLIFPRSLPVKTSAEDCHQGNNILDELRFERLLFRLIKDNNPSVHQVSDKIDQFGAKSEQSIIVSDN